MSSAQLPRGSALFPVSYSVEIEIETIILLISISASSTDLKSIQTHNVFSGVWVQLEPKVKPSGPCMGLQVIWQSLLKAIPGDN